MSKMRYSPELCARLIENGIDKYVMDAGRDTIALNAAIDSSCSGWARIPGPGACDFCVTLGSREDLYHSRFTAGGDERHGGDEDRFHPFCRCGVVPVFEKGGKAIAVDPETGKRIAWDRERLLDRYAEMSASDKVPHHRGGKGGKLSWERTAEYVERIKSAGTMDELKAICDDIDAAIPSSLKKSSQYRCLQMRARGRKDAIAKDSAFISSSRQEPIAASSVFANRSGEFYRRAKLIKPIDGYTDFVVHTNGNLTGFGYYSTAEDEKGERWTDLSVKDLAKSIRQSPEFDGGPIRLISCSSGKQSDGLAQQLANRLKVQVLAPDQDVYIDIMGGYNLAKSLSHYRLIAKGVVPETGRWISFFPR